MSRHQPLSGPPLESIAWALSIAGLLALGVHNAFIQDDAFISFRYAQNLVSEGELTWNPGEAEKIEGYTNFLWTMLIAAALACGLEPVRAAMVLSLACGFGTLAVTYRLARLHFESWPPALLAILFLGTNYTFSSYLTGGLETQLQAFLLASVAYLATAIDQRRQASPRALAGLSIACGLAVLTRMDSLLICAVYTLPLLAMILLRWPSATAMRRTSVLYLTVPGAVMIGTWLAWKLWYYGELLPNTYYVKATHFSTATLTAGAGYVYGFFSSYWLLPFFLVLLVYRRRITAHREWVTGFAAIALWLLYVVKVGGDFMEFRFFVPILPLISLLLAKLALAPADRRVRAFLIALVLFGSARHAMTFEGRPGIESIAQLDGHITGEDENWRWVGKILGHHFADAETPVTIATTAAGAIPFYSRLPTVDMLGPSDRWVAREGAVIGLRAGHRRVATLEYLLRRDVHLVIGHPQVRRRTSPPVTDLRRYTFEGLRPELLPDTTRIVDVPIDARFKISILYLTPHDDVDRVIEERGFQTFAIPATDA